MGTPVVYHPDYQAYDFGPGHPFSPMRLEMLLTLADALGCPVDGVTPDVATRHEVCIVHDDSLVEQVEAASSGTPRPDAKQFGLDTADVPVFANMDEAARTLVGGTLHAARLIEDGATRVLQLGGGLHHAQKKLASGFCVYNDLSVAIESLRGYGWRVAYLDIDVHHGDGVQWVHYHDPDILTLSLHESGRYLFPGTGGVHELGEGAGEGTAINVPLEPFTEDDSYLEAFDRVVPYTFDRFQPDVLVVQCGADAHFSDPLADLMLTTQAYERLFRTIFDLADQHTEGRCLLTLGGGYSLDATARIWTLLYLMACGLDIPDDLPSDWLDAWTERIGDRLEEPLTSTLHDGLRTFDIPRRSTIDQQNRQVSKRVLEMAAPLWY